MRLFQSSPARGGGCNAPSARLPCMNSAFQSSPARGGGCNWIDRAIWYAHEVFQSSPARRGGCNNRLQHMLRGGNGEFQSSPARGGGCNPYPQHTPSASVVASGWSVGREWGWIQMEQMERQFGKSHLRRVFWGFFGSICSICSICSMRAARQKSPAFEIIHNGRCIPAKLGCYSARINQSNPSLKTPP